MKEIDRILDQLRRSVEGDAWHGPSVREVLENVNAEKASAHPFAPAHSIWEITEHISAWQHYVTKRLEGEHVEPTPEQDWPAIQTKDEDAWKRTLMNLEQSYQNLCNALSTLKDEELEEKVVPGKPYSLYFMIHGVIQHNLFHAGQIAILKKQ